LSPCISTSESCKPQRKRCICAIWIAKLDDFLKLADVSCGIMRAKVSPRSGAGDVGAGMDDFRRRVAVRAPMHLVLHRGKNRCEASTPGS